MFDRKMFDRCLVVLMRLIKVFDSARQVHLDVSLSLGVSLCSSGPSRCFIVSWCFIVLVRLPCMFDCAFKDCAGSMTLP